jgi:hypothetical protein
MLHLVGVTPEAPTLDAAFRGGPPARVLDLDPPALRMGWRELTTAPGDSLDLVALGSPHFSLAEFRRLAPLLAGRRRDPNVEFLVTSSRIMVALAKEAGLLEPLEAFGGRVMVDSCILTMPMLQPSTKVLMTNSAKYAYYSPGLLGTSVAFGRLEVASSRPLWGESCGMGRHGTGDQGPGSGGRPRRRGGVGGRSAAELLGWL